MPPHSADTDWIEISIAFWKQLDATRPDLTRAPSVRPRLRGIDVYTMASFWNTLGLALQVFFSTHDRLPDLGPDATSADLYFAMKFFEPIPMQPNPASKLDAENFLGDTSSVRIPRRFGVGTALPANDAAPSGKYWLKLDLGNADHRQVTWPPTEQERAELEQWALRMTRVRYGWSWGEWWYAIGQQRFFLEEDLTAEISSGYELKIVVRRGTPAWLMALRYGVDRDGKRKVGLKHFLPDGQEITGETGYGTRGQVFSSAMDLPAAEGRDAAVAAAAQIGSRFDRIRVDFYVPLVGRPILGELSLCQSNARLALRPASFDLAMRRAIFD
jgi:hypothetical protein